MLPSKMGHACTSSFFGKTNSNDHKSLDDAFESCLNGMIIVPSKQIAKDTWHHCIHGPYDDPRPSRINFLNARLSTKFNGGTKLLKKVENIEKTFEYNRVDKTLSYLRSNLQKHLPSFQKPQSTTLSKINSSNF